MDNKSILQAANACITKGDYEGFLSFCSQDTRWDFIGDKVLSGKQSVREWMATEYKEPPQFQVDKLVAEDDFVTAIGKITLTDVHGTSRRYAYCDVWRFSDGKMAGLEAFVIEI